MRVTEFVRSRAFVDCETACRMGVLYALMHQFSLTRYKLFQPESLLNRNK